MGLTIEIPVRGSDRRALIDAEDFELVSKYAWRSNQSKKAKLKRQNLDYAFAYIDGRLIGMHAFVLGIFDGSIIDHKNHDGLDNRKENLRACTHAENVRNRRKYKPLTSRFKGVHVNHGGWRAGIRVNWKLIHLGYFPTEEMAAVAYNLAALKYFGEFACFNDGVDMSLERKVREISENPKKVIGTSNYRGVHHRSDSGTWRACLRITVGFRKTKLISLGCFRTEIEAARAYNVGAVEYFGEKAILNKI